MIHMHEGYLQVLGGDADSSLIKLGVVDGSSLYNGVFQTHILGCWHLGLNESFRP